MGDRRTSSRGRLSLRRHRFQVNACFAKEVLRDAKVATIGALEEAGGCPDGEGLRVEVEMIQQVRSWPRDRPHGNACFVAFSLRAPGCPWPPAPAQLRVGPVVALVDEQAFTEPAGDGNAHRIPDEFPALPSSPTTARVLGGRPIGRKPLQPLRVADVRRDETAGARGPDCRRRWNTEPRPPLQGRNGVDRPAETAEPLGPVKTAPELTPVAIRQIRSFVLIQQDGPWILGTGCEHEDALSSLRQAEYLGVDDAVRPGEPPVLELLDEPLHGVPGVEGEHEGDVLEQQPGGGPVGAVEQSKDMFDEARLGTADAGGTTGLAEVLAWKPSCDEIGLGKAVEGRDIGMDLGVGEAGPEHGRCRVIDLTEQGRPVPCFVQARLDSSDPREKSDCGQAGGWLRGGHDASQAARPAEGEHTFVRLLGFPVLVTPA